MREMCDVVQDLLPLYVEGMCSEPSADMIRGHLEDCACCRELYRHMCSDTGEAVVPGKRKVVMGHHANRQNQRTIACIIMALAIVYIPTLLVLPMFASSQAGIVQLPYPLALLALFLYTIPFWIAFIVIGIMIYRRFERETRKPVEKVLNVIDIVLAFWISLTIFDLENYLYVALILAGGLIITAVIRGVACRRKAGFWKILRQKALWICVLCLMVALVVVFSASVMLHSGQNRREESSDHGYSVRVGECGSTYAGVYPVVGKEELEAWALSGDNPTLTVTWVNETDEMVYYAMRGYIYRLTEEGWRLCSADGVDINDDQMALPAGRKQAQVYSLAGYDMRGNGRYKFLAYIHDQEVWVEFEVTMTEEIVSE